jgi:beta-ribofuranosylaminobenzene 5'-phosphate synthase
MSGPVIHVTAPSRLHFGLLSFGHPTLRQFGGVGAMINQPGLQLRISPAGRFEAHGPLGERVAAVAGRMFGLLELPLPACRIDVLKAPPEHVGLGTGTQLGLSVVAGLNAWRGRPALEPAELARLAGRAARSAVGTYGFLKGGLLFEPGKISGPGPSTDTELAPLERRAELPTQWRFVLICLHDLSGLSGDDEHSAFRDLPPVPLATTESLLHEVNSEMLPAAANHEFERFGDSVYRYGHQAGMCFAARQGGPFASPRIVALVSTIRGLGVRGVGQSSWGPTVFAILPNEAEAEYFSDHIGEHLGNPHTIEIVQPNNTGALITRHDHP